MGLVGVVVLVQVGCNETLDVGVENRFDSETNVQQGPTSLTAIDGDEMEAVILEEGFELPVLFRAECGFLSETDTVPEGMRIRDLIDCLTDESYAFWSSAYTDEFGAIEGAPLTLEAFLNRHGEEPLTAEPQIRALVEGPSIGVSVEDEGLMSENEGAFIPQTHLFNAGWGLRSNYCSGVSCLSESVRVVGGYRTIGYRTSSPDPYGAFFLNNRYLDDAVYGVFPDFRQAHIQNTELRKAGCGVVAAINLFEWWGMPIVNGSGTHLNTLNDRSAYIAGRIDTLQAINYTDDEELFDFLTDYRRELYDRGVISSYPGFQYMRGDRNGFKVMLNHVAQGHPVVALYATGRRSMHWAVVMGFDNGIVRIANGNDRTLSSFYNDWAHWDSMDIYAQWLADIVIERSSFYAYTGFGNGIQQPERFQARSNHSPNIGDYRDGWELNEFRYCLPDTDRIGRESESVSYDGWPDEPSASQPGYCLFNGRRTGFSLWRSPSSVWAYQGQQVSLSVARSWYLNTLLAENPYLRCEWWARPAGRSTVWQERQSGLCSSSSALTYSFPFDRNYEEVQFFVHSPDFLSTRWNMYEKYNVIWF